MNLAAWVLALGAGVAGVADLESLGWIVGTWERDNDRSRIYETWRKLSDRTFEGEVHRVSKATGDKVLAEWLLLVEMGGEVFYVPKVAENPYPVPFRLTSWDGRAAVFENPAHDFPQKIIYTMTSDRSLAVSIEGPADGRDEPQRIDFRFTRSD